MKYFLRHFRLEACIAIIGVVVSVVVYVVFRAWLKIANDDLVFVGFVNAGLLFVVGHVYSRLKDRRDSKRKRAQELFLEWHSKDIRESRIFVSRWLRVHKAAALPALGAMEEEAANACVAEYETARQLASNGGSKLPTKHLHDLDNPELKELHFFRIYQFFERWSLLVQHSDIDHQLASQYMTSYKTFYLNDFIVPWSKIETDKYIGPALNSILIHVPPPRGKHDG